MTWETVLLHIQRTMTIGLVLGAVGIVGSIVIDHFESGAIHTVITSALIVVLIAAALMLHHVAVEVEDAMEHEIGR